MKLFVGNKFKQTFCTDDETISFKVLSIDEDKDLIKVLCHKEGCQDWEESWDDLHNVYNAFLNGDYELTEQGFLDNKPIQMTIVNPYQGLDDYVPTFNENKLPFFKRKGSARKRR